MAATFELVLGETGALEDGRVNGVKDQVVLRTRKVEQAEAIDVLLVFGWYGDLWGV